MKLLWYIVVGEQISIMMLILSAFGMLARKQKPRSDAVLTAAMFLEMLVTIAYSFSKITFISIPLTTEMQFAVNFIAYVLPPLVIALFARHAALLIKERSKKADPIFHFPILLEIISFVLAIVLVFLGKVFIVWEGYVISAGSMIFLCVLINILSLVFITCAVNGRRALFKKKEILLLTQFGILQVIGYLLYWVLSIDLCCMLCNLSLSALYYFHSEKEEETAEEKKDDTAKNGEPLKEKEKTILDKPAEGCDTSSDVAGGFSRGHMEPEMEIPYPAAGAAHSIPVSVSEEQTESTESEEAQAENAPQQEQVQQAQLLHRKAVKRERAAWEFVHDDKGMPYKMLWDKNAAQLFGLAADPDLPMTMKEFLALVFPEDRKQIRGTLEKAIADAVKGIAAFSMNLRVKEKDGSYHWYGFEGHMKVGPNGLALKTEGSLEKLPELEDTVAGGHALEQALRKEHAPLRGRYEGKHVLLAGGDRKQAERLAEFLREIGFAVEHASDGKTCLDMIEKARAGLYDLLLLDSLLGEPEAGELIESIRRMEDREKAETLIVAMMADALERERLLKAGANGLLMKPVELLKLIQMIDNIHFDEIHERNDYAKRYQPRHRSI